MFSQSNIQDAQPMYIVKTAEDYYIVFFNAINDEHQSYNETLCPYKC